MKSDQGIFEEMGYQDDLKQYHLKGAGNPLNIKMSCLLGKSILNGIGANYLHNTLNKREKKEFIEKYGKYFEFENEPITRGHLRFGHAESLLPLFRLFVGLRTWVQSRSCTIPKRFSILFPSVEQQWFRCLLISRSICRRGKGL